MAIKAEDFAKKYGLEKDYLFMETLRYYKEQLKIIKKLKKSIDEEGPTVVKEYVKGRKNLCPNPAIELLNKTISSTNQTALTLHKFIESKNEINPEAKDAFAEMLGIETGK